MNNSVAPIHRAVRIGSSEDETTASATANGEVVCDQSKADDSSFGGVGSRREVRTFFSAMSHNFADLSTEGGDIPVDNFLNCCRSITPVFDVLGPTVFAPIKNDIQGNINKLQTTYECEAFASQFLLDMIQRERDAGKGLATDALLWLKRALEFICEFLKQIHSGNEALANCAEIAYGRTIKKYHSWITRGIFALAVKAMPRFPKFLQDLAPSEEDWRHPDYRRQVSADCGEYIVALGGVLSIINDFYRRSNLE